MDQHPLQQLRLLPPRCDVRGGVWKRESQGGAGYCSWAWDFARLLECSLAAHHARPTIGREWLSDALQRLPQLQVLPGEGVALFGIILHFMGGPVASLAIGICGFVFALLLLPVPRESR